MLKKLKARRLYVNLLLDAKSTGEKVGISEKTIGKWVRLGKWKEAREKTAIKLLAHEPQPAIPDIVVWDFVEFIKEKAPHLAKSIEPLANEYLKLSTNL